MITIAIVEDEEHDYQCLLDCLSKYKEENGLEIESTWFQSVEVFFNSFQKDKYNIIFMDIHLGEDNGMDASRKIRSIDKNTIIIFVSTLAQYAIQGYEVDALDFIVKPVTYYVFSMKFKKALDRLKRTKEILLPFTVNYGKVYIKASTIKFIEIVGHKIVIHTTTGDQITYGTLKSIEEMFKQYEIDYFGRCNNYLLVNFNFINKVDGLKIEVEGAELDISHPKKVKFLQDFNKFLGTGGI